MKKSIILASLVAFAFISCKKDRTCTCTVTQTASTTDGKPNTFSPAPINVTYKMTKVSKNGSHCFSNEETTTSTTSAGSTTRTDVDTYKYDCKLD